MSNDSVKTITSGEWKRDGEAIQVDWDAICYGTYSVGDVVRFDGVTCKILDTGSRFKQGRYAYGYLYVEKVAGVASQPAAPKGTRHLSEWEQAINDRAYDAERDDAMDRGELPTLSEYASDSYGAL